MERRLCDDGGVLPADDGVQRDDAGAHSGKHAPIAEDPRRPNLPVTRLAAVRDLATRYGSCQLDPVKRCSMVRLSSASVALAFLLSSSAVASAQSFTCDPEILNHESYRLATDAQAMNVTRPRTDW